MRFINPVKDRIELGQVEYVASEIMKNLPTYLGRVFERICLEVLSKTLTGYRIGRYWDKEGNEIDIVAIHNGESLFFECKFTEPRNSDAKLLLHRSEIVAKKLSIKNKKEYFVTSEKTGNIEGVEILNVASLVEGLLGPTT